jgi:hypothetical protein
LCEEISLDDTRRPNSLRLVALDVFEGKSTSDQVAVMRDLIETDPSFSIARDRDIFEYADTVGAFITDFVCEFVGQVLSRDPSIRAEDDRRSALSAESIEELEEH